MKTCFIFLYISTLVLLSIELYGQNHEKKQLRYFNTTTFDSLKYDLLISEIASFSKISTAKNVPAIALERLKVKETQKEFIIFEKSNWLSFDKSVKISIKRFDKLTHDVHFKDSILFIDSLKDFGCLKTHPNYQLYNIEYWLQNGYSSVSISSETLLGVYEPEISIDKCKVFSSKKGNRLYIYMLCGKKCEYEVIWVFEGKNYLGRVINQL